MLELKNESDYHYWVEIISYYIGILPQTIK